MNMNGLRTEFYESKALKSKTVFIALPKEAWRPIEGECACPFCKSHPELAPQWDTLAVDATGKKYSWMVHYPEFTNPFGVADPQF